MKHKVILAVDTERLTALLIASANEDAKLISIINMEDAKPPIIRRFYHGKRRSGSTGTQIVLDAIADGAAHPRSELKALLVGHGLKPNTLGPVLSGLRKTNTVGENDSGVFLRQT